MHMLMVIAGGTVLLGVFLLFGHLWGGTPASFAMAAKLFTPFWLVVSLANLWIGVSKAGYTVAEELPIFSVVFAVPAALAAVAIWSSILAAQDCGARSFDTKRSQKSPLCTTRIEEIPVAR